MDQERALKLCFDMVNPQDADLIILLERHGMSEAKQIAPSAAKIRRPIIAISADHADLCEAVFDITSEMSWRKIASFIQCHQMPSSVVPQGDAKLAASVDADIVMPPRTYEHNCNAPAQPQREVFDGEANVLRVLHQKRGQIVPMPSMGGGAHGSGDHGTEQICTAHIVDREASSHAWNKGARIGAGAQVLLIEGNEIGNPGLTLILAGAGHIVCRVQDAHATALAAAKTLFDVGVIDMNRIFELNIDLAGLVRSLRGAHRDLPIILVGSELSGKYRPELAGTRGVWLLEKASAQETLLAAVAAAISCVSPQSYLSEGINPCCSPSHRDQGEISPKR